MSRSRILTILLVFAIWLSTTGFQRLPEHLFSPPISENPSEGFPSVLAAPAFGKLLPADGATNTPATSLHLSWSPVIGYEGTGTISYRYCLQTKTKCPPAKWIKTGENTSVTVNNLLPGKKYYWWIRAYVGKTVIATADAGSSWSFTTMSLPGTFNKSTPVNFSTEQSTTDLALSWGASSGAVSYEYCYDTSNNNACDTGWVPAGSATTATISSLPSNAVYYWQVRASNDGGTVQANGGTWWQFTTRILPGVFNKLSPPDNSTGQPVNGLILSWAISSNAVRYEYCISQNSSQAEDTCDTTWQDVSTSTSATINGLSYNTVYYWKARTYNDQGYTYADSQIWWAFTTQGPPPTAFNKLTPTDGVLNQYTDAILTWQASGNADYYEYCVILTNDTVCDDSWTRVDGTSIIVEALDFETPYYWQVRAVNATSTVEANGGDWWVFTTHTNPPGEFYKAAPADGSARISTASTLSWNPSYGTGVSYQVCYDTSNDGLCANENWSSAQGGTTFDLTGLAYGTQYFWQVRAVNSTGTTYADSDMAAWWSFTTMLAPPSSFRKTSPDNLAADQPLNIFLDWESSDPGVTYEYCVGPGVGVCASEYNWVATTSTSVPLANLERGTTYYWQVRAKNSEETTTYSDTGNWWSFVTIPNPPAAFTKETPVDSATIVATNPTLTWNPSATPGVHYSICFDTTDDDACAGESWQPVASGASFDLSGLSYGTTYYWQVRATNPGGVTYADEDASTWWSFTTMLPAPAAFKKIDPENGATSLPLGFSLTWSESYVGVEYEVCYDTSEDNTCNGDAWSPVTTGTVYALSELSYGTTYYWQVRALNSEATLTEADSGDWWSFTTMQPPPAAFTKNAPANGDPSQPPNLTLEWHASDPGVTYAYCISPSSGACESEEDWVTASGTSAAPAGLSFDTTYYWQVRARNSENTITYADSGNWWSFTTYSQPPVGFVKLSPANNAANQPLNPTLSWADAGAGFTYEYCVSQGAPFTCGAGWTPVAATSVQVSGLANAATYSWQVRAKDSSGHTTDANAQDASPIWQFSTRPVPPASSDVTYNNIDEDQSVADDLPGANEMIFAPSGAQPAGALNLTSAGHFTYQPPLNFVGDVQFQFTVTDGINDPSGPYTVTINYISVNDPPVLDPIADITIHSGEVATFTPSARDPDLLPGGKLTFSIDALPAGASFDTSSGIFQWLALWQPGASEYTLTVTVSDGEQTDHPVQQTVRITVLPLKVFLPYVQR